MTHPLVEQFMYRCENQPKHIDNGLLYAGSSMYFYCKFCGNVSDILPESYISPPSHVCDECDILKEAGILADALAAKEDGKVIQVPLRKLED